ncbi:hypothetical protein SAMN05443144_12458 [Fodinibius roseus]|uniref:Uncharacterized protein n=1 Tax=Fodinibius roseus TaxID=1194090 RepID=A0A1M5ITK3_9BACT|nr:hypothetical protein [Fodinibius roseus]SHG31662.1 hypothetical protein SAMN05443144_12458 [Fodinibius roseus]
MNRKKHHITLKDFSLESGKISFNVLQSSPIKEQLDLKRLRAEQEYKGTRLDNVIGEWPGDESIGELLGILEK